MNDVVTIKFPDATSTRVGTVRLRWANGKSLRLYFHEPALRAEGLIARSFRCYIYKESNEKVRLAYQPKSGETLTLVYAPRVA